MGVKIASAPIEAYPFRGLRGGFEIGQCACVISFKLEYLGNVAFRDQYAQRIAFARKLKAFEKSDRMPERSFCLVVFS